MSSMSTQRRKLMIDRKPKSDRHCVKGDYMKWLKSARAQLARLFSTDEYLKHPANRRDMILSINRDRAARDDAALANSQRTS